MKKVLALALFSLFILFVDGNGQPPPPPPPKADTQPADVQIDATTRSQVIDQLLKDLNDGYVFPDVAKQMETAIRDRQKAKEYDSITSPKAFTEKLTADLQAISKDKHLRVTYSERPIPIRQQRGEPTEDEKARFNGFMKGINYGFNKVERLKHNIGYIEFRGFFDPEGGADTVAAAMNFVANTDYLIFDIRQNGGGDPAMVALICSYLFGDKPVHLNDLYFREGNKTEEFWTKPAVAGKKYGPVKEIYVLTSNRTFSGAEEFANNLKVLKRATIVGETTGGGANPGGSVRLNEHFQVFVPGGRAINPITKTNWEGVGVEPDVKVPKEQALLTAQLAIIGKLIENQKEDDMGKKELKATFDTLTKELDELKKTAKK